MSPRRHPDDDNEKPLRISDRGWFSFPGGVVVGLLTAAVGVGVLYANMNSRQDRAIEGIATNAKRLDDHESRIRPLEGDVREMKVWVKDLHDWMSTDRAKRSLSPTASNP